jgi:hypothetical protein
VWTRLQVSSRFSLGFVKVSLRRNVLKKRRADLGEFARGAEVGDADGGVGGGEEVLDVGRAHVDWTGGENRKNSTVSARHGRARQGRMKKQTQTGKKKESARRWARPYRLGRNSQKTIQTGQKFSSQRPTLYRDFMWNTLGTH